MSDDPRVAGRDYPCSSRAVDQSFLVPLLPGVEQSALYNHVNSNLAIEGPENRTIQSSWIGVYSCPSDPDSSYLRPLHVEQFIAVGFARPGETVTTMFTSYSGNYGSCWIAQYRPCGDGRQDVIGQMNGVFNDLSPIGMASVRDGLSHTLFVAEKAVTRFRPLNAIDPNAFTRYGWYFNGNWGDTIFTAFFPPNAFRGVAAGALKAQVNSASSLHPGGLNAAMGDGSVRFITDSIQSWPFDPATGIPVGAVRHDGGSWSDLPELGVWQALGTRSGGEVAEY